MGKDHDVPDRQERQALEALAQMGTTDAGLLYQLGMLQSFDAPAEAILAGLAAVAPRLLSAFLGPQFSRDLDTAVAVMRILCVGAAAFTYAFSAGAVVNVNIPQTISATATASTGTVVSYVAPGGGAAAETPLALLPKAGGIELVFDPADVFVTAIEPPKLSEGKLRLVLDPRVLMGLVEAGA